MCKVNEEEIDKLDLLLNLSMLNSVTSSLFFQIFKCC